MSGESLKIKAAGRRGVAGAFSVDGVHCIVIAASESELNTVGEKLINRIPCGDKYRDGVFISSQTIDIMEMSEREAATTEGGES